MTGLDLYDELARAARAAGVGVSRFIRPLSSNPDTWLSQLKVAQNPTSRTIERVRALIEGRPIPPNQRAAADVVYCRPSVREQLGLPASGRMLREEASLSLTLQTKEAVELNRRLTELAHASRRPGQTVADRVRELRQEASFGVAA